jgi:uracil-DNA glycosylase
LNRREAIAALRQEAIESLTPLLTPDQRQVVFGSGDPESPLMLVGEAPGPQEDREGEPFVGPSGQLLNTALEKIGLDRGRIWISNTVKVWPTRRSGTSLKTRPPNAAEKKASRPFFEREIDIIRPRVILCLGGTAAQALISKDFKITRERGEWRDGPNGIPTVATYHPSYLIRLQRGTPEQGQKALEEFHNDLTHAASRAGLLEGVE